METISSLMMFFYGISFVMSTVIVAYLIIKRIKKGKEDFEDRDN